MRKTQLESNRILPNEEAVLNLKRQHSLSSQGLAAANGIIGTVGVGFPQKAKRAASTGGLDKLGVEKEIVLVEVGQ